MNNLPKKAATCNSLQEIQKDMDKPSSRAARAASRAAVSASKTSAPPPSAPAISTAPTSSGNPTPKGGKEPTPAPQVKKTQTTAIPASKDRKDNDATIGGNAPNDPGDQSVYYTPASREASPSSLTEPDSDTITAKPQNAHTPNADVKGKARMEIQDGPLPTRNEAMDAPPDLSMDVPTWEKTPQQTFPGANEPSLALSHSNASGTRLPYAAAPTTATTPTHNSMTDAPGRWTDVTYKTRPHAPNSPSPPPNRDTSNRFHQLRDAEAAHDDMVWESTMKVVSPEKYGDYVGTGTSHQGREQSHSPPTSVTPNREELSGGATSTLTPDYQRFQGNVREPNNAPQPPQAPFGLWGGGQNHTLHPHPPAMPFLSALPPQTQAEYHRFMQTMYEQYAAPASISSGAVQREVQTQQTTPKTFADVASQPPTPQPLPAAPNHIVGYAGNKPTPLTTRGAQPAPNIAVLGTLTTQHATPNPNPNQQGFTALSTRSNADDEIPMPKPAGGWNVLVDTIPDDVFKGHTQDQADHFLASSLHDPVSDTDRSAAFICIIHSKPYYNPDTVLKDAVKMESIINGHFSLNGTIQVSVSGKSDSTSRLGDPRLFLIRRLTANKKAALIQERALVTQAMAIIFIPNSLPSARIWGHVKGFLKSFTEDEAQDLHNTILKAFWSKDGDDIRARALAFQTLFTHNGDPPQAIADSLRIRRIVTKSWRNGNNGSGLTEHQQAWVVEGVIPANLHSTIEAWRDDFRKLAIADLDLGDATHITVPACLQCLSHDHACDRANCALAKTLGWNVVGYGRPKGNEQDEGSNRGGLSRGGGRRERKPNTKEGKGRPY